MDKWWNIKIPGGINHCRDYVNNSNFTTGVDILPWMYMTI